jgi:formate--tetrahydrofolate ligase
MLVPLCGDMLQMPGFGAQPAAYSIDLDESGSTVGLF